MCGIVGYVGDGPVFPRLLRGLERLEYRGYDSAGVAVLDGTGGLFVHKRVGSIADLRQGLEPSWGAAAGRDTADPETAGAGTAGRRKPKAGIGHTRWATHGPPSRENAHPLQDCTHRFAIVHNGVLENAPSLRDRLEAEGHAFSSETDSEVIAHLLEAEWRRRAYDAAEWMESAGAAERDRGEMCAEIVRAVLHQVDGSFALGIVCRSAPGVLVAASRDSPLILGMAEEGNWIASDMSALLPDTDKLHPLEDGEVALLSRRHIGIRELESGRRVGRRLVPLTLRWGVAAAPEKGGYPHYMLKEIYEQSRAVRDTLAGRLTKGRPHALLLDGIEDRPADLWSRITQIQVVGSGSALHAGWVGASYLEQMTRISTRVELASEFRYRDSAVGPATLVVAVSQSGETADTLGAAREARRRGAFVLGITNVQGSVLTQVADAALYTRAGPEISVASTKTYTTQLVVLLLLAFWAGRDRGWVDPVRRDAFLDELNRLPVLLDEALRLDEQVQMVAARILDASGLFYIGRGLDHPVAAEAALKLKEITYLRAEAHAGGELKHGTLALVEPGVAVIALATQERLFRKMLSNAAEVRARGGEVIAVVQDGWDVPRGAADRVLALPRAPDLLQPAIAILPLQLLAYHTAVLLGRDVDRPRNLAKSVTVE